MACGIIIGSDQAHQRLLPTWWLNYRLHNNFPVTFIDFGMDERGVEWCRARGRVIPLTEKIVFSSYSPEMKKVFGHLPQSVRSAWFKKPLACLKTPYERTLWVDTDCLIRAHLGPLFEHASSFALTEEPKAVIDRWRKLHYLAPHEKLYNSGVIAFEKNSPLLPLWVEACKKRFRGDQEALSAVFYQHRFKPLKLPPTYNWILTTLPMNKKAHILHFAGKSKQTLMTLIHQAETSLKQPLQL